MKTKIAATLITLGFLAGCGNDDDTSASFFGTWIATNIEIRNCDDPENDDFRSVQCSDVDCYRLDLETDGTYAFQQGLVTQRGDWSATDAVITFVTDNEGETVRTNASGRISSGTLRLTFTSDTDNCETSYIMDRQEETSTN